MAGLRGVLSRDLAVYVNAAYRSGWSDGRLDPMAATFTLDMVNHRQLVRRLLNYGFTEAQIMNRLTAPALSTRFLRQWLTGVGHGRWGLDSIIDDWVLELNLLHSK